jgi:hypothetical protein
MSDQSSPLMSDMRLNELRTQAQYARERYDLYKARAYGPRVTSVARLRELERECTRAEAILRFALQETKRARLVDNDPDTDRDVGPASVPNRAEAKASASNPSRGG